MGKASERVVLTAAHELRRVTPWIDSVRPATPAEESRGADLVVTTDLGAIWVQVKSSERGAREHRLKYPDPMIGLIVVHGPDDTTVRRRLLAELVELHDAIVNGVPTNRAALYPSR